MLIILTIIIVAAALALVAYPIIARSRAAQPAAASSAGEELAELLARRDATLQALRDLNFDRQVGKVTDEDFAVFEANLKAAAAGVLAALDAWEAAADRELDAVLERAVAARRAALTSGRTCPACGRPAAAEDKFCAGCGAALPAREMKPAPAAGPTCPKCGRPVGPTDRFCGGCGAALA
ncbi:MAG: zinc ribbon domain-containing protein [Anaerolineae bacterium]|nr:zinc ribbon domain-containing protein [Anaerolineae bacterium]